MICSFCGRKFPRSKGKMLLKTSGKKLPFCSSKCERNWKLGRDPRKLKWTKAGRLAS